MQLIERPRSIALLICTLFAFTREQHQTSPAQKKDDQNTFFKILENFAGKRDANANILLFDKFFNSLFDGDLFNAHG